MASGSRNAHQQQQDDAIASLMSQMGQQQGYKEESSSTTTRRRKRDNDDDNENDHSQSQQRRRQRLIPELSNYPNNGHCAGSQSIWNAHVQPQHDFYGDVGPFDSTSTTIVTLPTNPQVEIIRRRCFEKFKKEALENMQRILHPPQQKHRSGNDSHAQSQNIQAWKQLKLPTIPSMLEKWHMDAKLEERERIMARQRKNEQEESNDDKKDENLLIIDPNTSRIFQKTMTQLQSKHQQDFYDPILVSKDAPSRFKKLLAKDVQKAAATAGISAPRNLDNKCKQITKMLYKLTCQALESYPLQLQQACILQQQQSNSRRRKGKKEPGDMSSFKIQVTQLAEVHQIQIVYAGISLRIHMAYYEKLQRLYDRSSSFRKNNGNVDNRDTRSVFHQALFCLLCRYDMLQGAGLQAGVPGSVMDVLLMEWNCQMECFASPLNCRYEAYASAFDLDRWVGSVGSFFDLDFMATGGGCFQANPPFCEDMIGKLNDKMVSSLQACREARGGDEEASSSPIPLMFIVFVPAWKESSSSYRQLLDNPYLTRHVLLEQGKHWYTEGTQHRRKQSYRVASFDTSIFFYQNDAAKDKWPLLESSLERLKHAFCQDPGSMDKTTTTTTAVPTKKTTIMSAKTNEAAIVDASSSTKQETKDFSATKRGHPMRQNLGDEEVANSVDSEKATRSLSPVGRSETSMVVLSPNCVAENEKSNKTIPKRGKQQNKNANADSKTKKKRKWISQGQDEKSAQLDLLQSLGLGAATTNIPTTTSTSNTTAGDCSLTDQYDSNRNNHRGKGKHSRKKPKRGKRAAAATGT